MLQHIASDRDNTSNEHLHSQMTLSNGGCEQVSHTVIMVKDPFEDSNRNTFIDRGGNKWHRENPYDDEEHSSNTVANTATMVVWFIMVIAVSMLIMTGVLISYGVRALTRGRLVSKAD